MSRYDRITGAGTADDVFTGNLPGKYFRFFGDNNRVPTIQEKAGNKESGNIPCIFVLGNLDFRILSIGKSAVYRV